MFLKTLICVLVIRQTIYADPELEEIPNNEKGPHYTIDNDKSESTQEAENNAIDEDNFYDFNVTHEIIKDSMTCEEFVGDYVFDPFQVLDREWTVFYFWLPHFEEPFTAKFTMVPKKIREQYREELDKEMKPRIDWDDAFLYMASPGGLGGLIIKTEFKSIFYIVSSLALEYYNIPPMLYALKVVEPHGYLAMIDCTYRTGYALARTEKLPYYMQYAQEAAKIGFRSKFGRTHIHESTFTELNEEDFNEEDHDNTYFPPIYVNAR